MKPFWSESIYSVKRGNVPNDVLPNYLEVWRPTGETCMPIAGSSEITRQSIDPDVDGMLWIIRDWDTPG